MALGDSFGALRKRRFRLLWIGQATSTLGDGLVPVALASQSSRRSLRRLDEPEPEELLSALPGDPAEALHGT